MSEVAALAAKIESEGEKVVEVFSRLTPDQWQALVYTEGGTWTVRNVLAHFVTSERGLLKLFEQIRQGGAGAAEDFSIDRYNAAMQERTQAASPQELLQHYREIRAKAVAWVSSLKESDLELTGRHPYLGQTVIREMIKMLYIHNLTHLRDMKKVIQ